MLSRKTLIRFGVFVVVMALSALTANSVHAAPIDKVPVTVTQPDGTKLNLFASGDEFYNWLQDAQGYTVIQDPNTGYYVYADLVNGSLVPTNFIVERSDPASVGLYPYINIPPKEMAAMRRAFLDQTKRAAGVIRNAPRTGTINNLVLFIRFSDEPELTNTTSTFTDMLNSSVTSANSLRNYYQEVSYNALTIDSTLFPVPGATIISYQDGHPRGYYQPYNAVTNPAGYTGGDNGTERRVREHTLLRDAVNYVSGLGQFPSGASVDSDGDGYVDSITFVVSGSPTGWSSLLWPHQWSLYTYPTTINGKIVGSYSFQLVATLNNGVLAHEMFHVLGSPDLYHYTSNGIQPVGGWDVMEYTANPPQHMGCFMKFKYGNWINIIPEINGYGTYSLSPLTSPTNNCYKIPSPYSTTEYFIVEYRREAGSTFENSLPGTGLLVYRINTLANGNAYGPPDEIYIYRPGGTTTVNGNISAAHFGVNVGRTAINDSTDPSSFLSDGSMGGLSLCNIGSSNVVISFDICSSSVFTISGNAGVGGVTLSYTDGTPKTVTSDPGGLYSITVPSGWSGTITPTKDGATFSPPSRTYTNVLENQTGQNYVATAITAPSVLSIIRKNANPTAATSVDFTVSFSENVTGVDLSDFALTTSGVSGATVSGVNGTGSTYTVTVNTGTRDGTIRLDVVDDNSIMYGVGNPLGGAGMGDGNFTSGESYDIDKTVPTVVSSLRVNPSPTLASSVDFIVTFSETVSKVDAGDFNLTTTGVSGATVSGVSGIGSTYTVTVSTGSGSGTIRLDVVDDNSIVDGALNLLGGTGLDDGDFTAGEIYVVNKGGGTTGVFRPSNGVIFLKNANTSGFADININYGMGGDYPIVGDWDGDGKDTIGIYRNGVFYLRNSNTVGFADISFAFGTPGDQPIAGDWNGDGIDSVGVFHGATVTFYLRNQNTAGAPDTSFQLGLPGDVGIAGDWDGDGKDTTGVFRPSNGVIFLKNTNTTGFADVALNYGIPGDQPVTGDWNSDGIDTIGVYRNGRFLLRNSNTVGFADIVFALGIPGDMPIAGNWDGIP